MIDQNAFMITLKEVSEIIRTSAIPMTKEEILAYFKDMDLTGEQKEMIFTYLSTPHEDPEPEVEQPEEPIEETSKMDDVDALEALAAASPVFQMYMADVQALPPVTAEEMNELYHRLQQGDKEAPALILSNWLPMVLQASKKFFREQVNLEDVIQEGNMGLFMRLTELLGTDHDIMRIQLDLDAAMREAMKNYISEMASEEDSEDTIAGKANLVAQAKKTLKEEMRGIEPSMEQLSEYTHLSVEELEDIMQIMKKAEDVAAKKAPKKMPNGDSQ